MNEIGSLYVNLPDGTKVGDLDLVFPRSQGRGSSSPAHWDSFGRSRRWRRRPLALLPTRLLPLIWNARGAGTGTQWPRPDLTHNCPGQSIAGQEERYFVSLGWLVRTCSR